MNQQFSKTPQDVVGQDSADSQMESRHAVKIFLQSRLANSG